MSRLNRRKWNLEVHCELVYCVCVCVFFVVMVQRKNMKEKLASAENGGFKILLLALFDCRENMSKGKRSK